MPRKYTVEGNQEVDGSGGAATETQLVITNADDQIVRITRITVGQPTHETAEMYLAELQRTSTAGSGGSAPVPSKNEIGDPVSSVTVGAGPTSEPVYTANTVLLSRPWNAVLGFEKVWTEKEAPVIPPDGIIALKLTAKAGSTAFTPDVEIEFEEVG